MNPFFCLLFFLYDVHAVSGQLYQLYETDAIIRKRLPAGVSVLRSVIPAMLPVIDHQFCHTAVYTDVFTRDKSSLSGTKEKDHLRDILRFSNAACRLLERIRPGIIRIGGINPYGFLRREDRILQDG